MVNDDIKIKMKVLHRFKSISFITICFNFASPYPQSFYKVDKYIENFEFVTDDDWLRKDDTVTEHAFIGDYFESPKRNVQKDNDEEYKAIKKEYLKELEEEKANELNKVNQIDKGDKMRKSQGGSADDKILNRICGADKTDSLKVMEGPADIESFPWLGVLIYPKGKVRLITTVILVTRNTVIGSALDIERLPKLNFRRNSKVILGQTCKRPGIKVLDYNYHPDYGKETYSSVVLIQIDRASVFQALWPVCGPPKALKVSTFYTITLPNDCRISKIEIFSMEYVKPEACKHYYRRTGLDLGSIWPKHGACGRARAEEECLWRNGAALVVKERGRWHLMGIGINGPGCAAPSRYVDYAAYSGWVADSVARIGRPALTRLADNHLILRRTIDTIQRYGPCDANEVQTELFCDRTNTTTETRGKVKYNLTLIESYDYTCIALKANSRYTRPKISIQGICDSPHPICYSASRFLLDFYIEIAFNIEVWFKICAYGKLVAVPDPKAALKYFNRKKPPVPIPWGLSSPTNNEKDTTTYHRPSLGLDVPTTPTVETNMTDTEEPGLPTGEELLTLTTVMPTDNKSSSLTPPEPTGDELWTSTTIMPTNEESSSEPTQEFWTLTPVMPADGESSSEPTHEFWTVTPAIPKDEESPLEPTPEFWSLTPIMPSDNESSSLTPPESTGEFWTVTPVIPKDEESPFEPTPEFWSLTPIMPSDNESSSLTPPESTGEFWTVTPVIPKDEESPLEPTPEFWSLTPIMPSDNESSSLTPPESTGEFWTVTPVIPKDEESPLEPTPEFWSLTPIMPSDNESSSLTPPESTGEFWTVTPVIPKDEESPFEPTPEFWSFTPIMPRDNESSSVTLPEPTGEFWTLTPVVPKEEESPFESTPEFWSFTPIMPSDSKSSSLTPLAPTGEFETLTPVIPKDEESPFQPTPEFWSFTPIMPSDNKSSSLTPPEPTGEFWTLRPVIPKDEESPFEPTPEFWSFTPIMPSDSESSSPPEYTGEFWTLRPVIPKHKESPNEPTPEFWSLTPIIPEDNESSSLIPPELTDKFWSLTPIWPKDEESPSVMPPEPTEEFRHLTPVLPSDDQSSPAIPIKPTGEFWDSTPVIPKDDESPSVNPIEPSGEYWSLPPFIKEDDSSFVSPIEPTGEFWSLTPVMPNDNEFSSVITTDQGKFSSLTPFPPKDDESPSETPVKPTGEFWSLTPVMPDEEELSPVIPVAPTSPVKIEDKESSSAIPVESTDEFWILTPASTSNKDDDLSSVIPAKPTEPVKIKDDESSFATPEEPTGEFWSLTPIMPKDGESATEPIDESWSLIPVVPYDDESSSETPLEPTGDFWSLGPVLPIENNSFSATPFEPTGKFSSLRPVFPKDNKPTHVLPLEPPGEFWSFTPILPKYEESSFVIPTESPDDAGDKITIEPIASKPGEELPWWTVTPFAFTELIIVTDVTASLPDEKDITSITEDPQHPWWIDTYIASTDMQIIPDKVTQSPGETGVTDSEYDPQQPWWTVHPIKIVNTESTGLEDVFTNEQKTKGPVPDDITLIAKGNHTTLQSDFWAVIPVNTETEEPASGENPSTGKNEDTKINSDSNWAVIPVKTREPASGEDPSTGKNKHTKINSNSLWATIPVNTETEEPVSDENTETVKDKVTTINSDSFSAVIPMGMKTEEPASETSTENDKATKVNSNSYWNTVPGSFMPPNDAVTLAVKDNKSVSLWVVTSEPEATAEERIITPINEPEDTEDLDLFWAVTPFVMDTDVLKEDLNKPSPELAKPNKAKGIVSKKLKYSSKTEKSASLATLSELLSSNSEKILKTISSPLLFNTKIKLEDKNEVTSAKAVSSQSAKHPALEDKDLEASQLEKFEKALEDMINVKPLTFLPGLYGSIPSMKGELHEKTDMTSAKTFISLNTETSPLKHVPEWKDIISVTPVTIPVDLEIVTTKAKDLSEESDTTDKILRMSKIKQKFNPERFVKPQMRSFQFHKPFYLRTLVTRRQKMTEKSIVNIKPALIKRRRPGILSKPT